MSTQINVTVGKAGLSDKAKRQTTANRQAKLEADARAKAEAEGKRQRELNRLQQGLTADGKPLYGVPSQAPARKDEPAAFRRAPVFEWSIEPSAATQTGTYAFTAVTKAAKQAPLVFTASNSSALNGLGSSTSGPGGSGYSLRNTSRGGDLRATSTDFQMDGKPDFTFETYVKLNGVQVPNSLMQVDHYVWVLGTQYSFNGGSAGRRHYIYMQYEKWTDRDRIEVYYDRYTTGGLYYEYNRLTNTPTLEAGAWTKTPGFNVALNPGEWFHLAVTRKSQVIYFFINGQLAAYGSDANGPSDIDADKVTINGVTDFQVTSSEVSMAKTRFIQKALYTSNFTPP